MTVDLLTKPLENRRVLVVEDAPDNRYLFSFLLEEWGAAVDVAEHGGEAVSLVRERDYDLILMDINMPIMDGFEAMVKLKEGRNHPPVVALTAYNMEGQEPQLSDYGFDSYLIKPIDPEKMIHKISNILAIGV